MNRRRCRYRSKFLAHATRGRIVSGRDGSGRLGTRIATCHCGQLSITVEGEPAMVTACNCTRCQKRSGSAFSLSSRWTTEQVTNRTGDSLTYTRKGASGGDVHCVFCPQCGSTVSTSLELFPASSASPLVASPTRLSRRRRSLPGARPSLRGCAFRKGFTCCGTRAGRWIRTRTH